jgi:hypothetical protein
MSLIDLLSLLRYKEARDLTRIATAALRAAYRHENMEFDVRVYKEDGSVKVCKITVVALDGES